MAKKERYTRPKTIYQLSSRRIVPGVTTILDCASGKDKLMGMVKAAISLTKDGYDALKEWEALAEIGSATHERIRAHLRQEEPDLSFFSPNIVKASDVPFDSFLLWYIEHEVKLLAVEEPLVSEQYGYGGTLDLLALVDDVATLVDFKTGSVYDDAFVQSAAYRQLLTENGLPHARAIILQIPRGKKEKFAVHDCDNWAHDFEVFLACLRLYQLRAVR